MKRTREERIDELPVKKRQKSDVDTPFNPLGGLVEDVWNIIFEALNNDMYSKLQLSLSNKHFRALFRDKVKDIIVSDLGKPTEHYWDLNRILPPGSEIKYRPTQYHLYHRSQPTPIIITEDDINSLFDSIKRPSTHTDIDLPIFDGAYNDESDNDSEESYNNSDSESDIDDRSESVEQPDELAETLTKWRETTSMDVELRKRLLSLLDCFYIPDLSICSYEVHYHEDSIFVLLQRDYNFLLLECTIEQSSESAPRKQKIVSYEWQPQWLSLSNVFENKRSARMVVYDQIMMIVQPSSLVYFFDLENKQCMIPTPIPNTALDLQTDIIRTEAGTFIRFTSNMAESENGTPTLDYYIRVPSDKCNQKIVPCE
uniref:Transmembrane protein n=1 Tax=Clandestinovirus TaxID=2831644 RepID=A0A8F8PQQ1_9VIRU|nr:transmembrane protein [Clandestinovirus]